MHGSKPLCGLKIPQEISTTQLSWRLPHPHVIHLVMVMCLPPDHEDLSLDPQGLCKTQGGQFTKLQAAEIPCLKHKTKQNKKQKTRR